MKLRFRSNSLRLRVNRREVESLSRGSVLREQVQFPGDAQLAYLLEKSAVSSPQVDFAQGTIRITIPSDCIEKWARGDEIGMYFELPANGSSLKVAIEKDLACVDGPVEELDPDAYPRSGKNC